MTATVTLHEGDNREHLRRLIDAGVRVHSVVTDPPYGLVSVTKRFGADGAAPAKFGSDGAFQRASGGFMGSRWDATGIERDPEFWRLIYDILLPGGYVVAFSSSRTYHRMAVAIEDAGFITHPMLGWLFGSGFPKAHNAAMAIDKHLGAQGGFEVTGDPVKRMIPGAQQHATGDWTKTEDRDYQPGRRVPGSPEAAQWEGWAYGAQALKPALEPIYVGQKPFDGKSGAPSILKHGTGAINIDACRIETGEQVKTFNRIAGDRPRDQYRTGTVDGPPIMVDRGRWPANLLRDGSDEVVALFPTSAGSGSPRALKRSTRPEDSGWGMNSNGSDAVTLRDAGAGSAARFFNAFPADEPYPVFYQAKAGKADRAGSKHPTVKPIALMQWLCRLVTPSGGTVLDPFSGSGTTGEAASREGFNCILMEAEPQFAADIRTRFELDLGMTVTTAFDDLLGGDGVDDLEVVLG